MKINRLLFAGLFCSACFFACRPESFSGENLEPLQETTAATDRQITPDQLINPFFTKFKLAGLSCALIKGDSLVFSKGYGKANLQTNTAATANTVFLTASVSKTATAVAMMKLVQQGLINLDADISTYLPFAVKNPFHPTKKITCRQLLSHTSSIVDDRYDLLAHNVVYTYGADHSMPLATFCLKLFKPGQQWYSTTTWVNKQPGTFYEYSNIGITLAGYIVERVANQPFDQYCNAQIFAPLGMSSTHWRLAQIPAAVRAMPYKTNNTAYGHYTFVDYPDGGLRTNVKNMSRFLRMFALGGTSQGVQVLSPATVATMKTKHFPNVAGAEDQRLVWYDLQTEHYNLIGHSGEEQGVLGEMYYNPATNAGVIIFINKDVANGTLYDNDMDILVDKLIGVAEAM